MARDFAPDDPETINRAIRAHLARGCNLLLLTSGTWTAYQGTGKLANIKGKGTFTVKPGDKHDVFILEMVGEYEL